MFLSQTVHVPYHRCHGRLNSLSKPLQLGHFITIVKILAAVRLKFQLGQFNIGRYGNGYTRDHHCLGSFLFQPSSQLLSLSQMVIFDIIVVTDVVRTNQIHSHRLYTVTLLPTDHTYH